MRRGRGLDDLVMLLPHAPQPVLRDEETTLCEKHHLLMHRSLVVLRNRKSTHNLSVFFVPVRTNARNPTLLPLIFRLNSSLTSDTLAIMSDGGDDL